jgi:hypothetical protein
MREDIWNKDIKQIESVGNTYCNLKKTHGTENLNLKFTFYIWTLDTYIFDTIFSSYMTLYMSLMMTL